MLKSYAYEDVINIMHDHQKLYQQLEILVRRAGFKSVDDAPQAVVRMLILTAPKSPLRNDQLADFMNEYAYKKYGPALGKLKFTTDDVHKVFLDIAKGIAYVANHYPGMQLDDFMVTPEVHFEGAPPKKNFHAMFLGNKAQGTTHLIISPDILISLLLRYKSPQKEKTREFEELSGQRFYAHEFAQIIGIEEAFHAHQYFTNTLQQNKIHADSDIAGRENDPDEIAAKKVVDEAAKELGLGSKYAGRKK